MRRIDKNVLNKVKNTFNRMGISGIGMEGGKKTLDPLVTMNIPPNMARRDSAYDRTVHLLKEHIFVLPEKERSAIYAAASSLLKVAIDSSRYIATGNGIDLNKDPILQYLKILRDTVSAANALLKYEIDLFDDKQTIAGFIGSDITSQFVSAEEIFSSSEMNIFHSINDLVDVAEPAVKRNRESCLRSFSKNDLRRYKKALAEFNTLYSGFGKMNISDSG